MSESFAPVSAKDKEEKPISRLRRTGLFLSTALTAAAIAACGGGDSRASTPSYDGENSGEVATATAPTSLAEASTPTIVIKKTEAPIEKLPVRSLEPLPPGRAIIAFAKEVVQPKYVPNLTEINEAEIINTPTKPRADKTLPNYARRVKVGGNELFFATFAEEGISKGEFVRKDRYRQVDSSEKAMFDMMRTFLKVPEDAKFNVVDYGKGVIGYEFIANRTADFQISFVGYRTPDIGSSTPDNPLTIFTAIACSVPSTSEQYANNSCLNVPNG